MAWEPLASIVQETLTPPPVKLKAEEPKEEESIASLNTTVIGVLMDIPAVPLDGIVELTIGGVVSGASFVVKDHVESAAMAFPAISLTPTVIVAVYPVLLVRGADGVKVAVVPLSFTVPGMLVDPCLTRKVVVVTVSGSTGSLNVALTEVFTGTAA